MIPAEPSAQPAHETAAETDLLELRRRSPDADLVTRLREVLDVYRGLVLADLERKGAADPTASFRKICGWMDEAARGGHRKASKRSATPENQRRAVVGTSREILERPDGLQRLASLLAMLAHYAVDHRTQDLLVNRRRPRRESPSYPTAPALARLVGKQILDTLVPVPVPRLCASAVAAERYAARAFSLRIVDPSMESGQLLLGVAEAALERIHERHPKESRAGHLLARAVLERLAERVLWGSDRDELAVTAVRHLFGVLGVRYGMDRLEPKHLIRGNALELLGHGELTDFDGLVNNPPWGVRITARDRQRLRKAFDTVEHRTDLYVPFTELALRSVRPGGALVLILPAQAVAARNTQRLRARLLDAMTLERVVLLPRASFAAASVRGVLLAGRQGHLREDGSCQVTSFPLVKRFDGLAAPKSFDVDVASLKRRGERSWWPLLSGGPFTNGSAKIVSLDRLAKITFGVQVHRVGRGEPPQTREAVRRRAFLLDKRTQGTVGAIRGRDVRQFEVRKPARFVRLGKWLACVGDHEELRLRERILVREICRRDGRLSAAAPINGDVPLHGVLTVIPELINADVLLGILNSSAAAEYVRHHTASFSKVDFQRITVTEMREFPVPVIALTVRNRRALGLHAPTSRGYTLRTEVGAVVRALKKGGVADEPARSGLIERLDEAVRGLYDLAT